MSGTDADRSAMRRQSITDRSTRPGPSYSVGRYFVACQWPIDADDEKVGQIQFAPEAIDKLAHRIGISRVWFCIKIPMAAFAYKRKFRSC